MEPGYESHRLVILQTPPPAPQGEDGWGPGKRRCSCATPSRVNLLEPWIFARLAAGVAATALFVQAAWVSLKVMRFFRLGATSEGQLALERQAELAAAAARVGAVLQGAALLLSLTAADRLSGHLRGAMCGFGVVHAVTTGPAAVIASGLASLAALVLGQLLALDRRERSLSLVRPLAAVTTLVAVLGVADLALTATWLGGLDFSVVASCCSSGLDAGEDPVRVGLAATGRSLAAALAPAFAAVAAWLAWRASRSGRRPAAIAAGLASLVALPAAVAATVLVVAPHVYEVPQHRCPYCLFRADALWMGYPLLAALLVAAASALGAALAARWSPRDDGAFADFAPPLLRRSALAWLVALALALAPVVRYAILSGGHLL